MSKFDLIFQNNGSKKTYILQKLENLSENNLYFEFQVDLSEYPKGEYSYFLIRNERNDVEYDINCNEVLKMAVKTSEGTVKLGDLRPITGLLRIGSTEDTKDTQNAYKKAENNVFYYKNK